MILIRLKAGKPSQSQNFSLFLNKRSDNADIIIGSKRKKEKKKDIDKNRKMIKEEKVLENRNRN